MSGSEEKKRRNRRQQPAPVTSTPGRYAGQSRKPSFLLGGSRYRKACEALWYHHASTVAGLTNTCSVTTGAGLLRGTEIDITARSRASSADAVSSHQGKSALAIRTLRFCSKCQELSNPRLACSSMNGSTEALPCFSACPYWVPSGSSPDP
jgi:hypothetical protein